VSPDGQFVASGSADQTVRIWRLKTMSQVAVLPHSEWVWSIAFSPDGSNIATASEDGIIRLWDIKTETIIHSQLVHKDAVLSIRFHPARQLLLSTSRDGTTCLWDIQDDDDVVCLDGNGEAITEGVFSPDGTRFATSSVDGFVRIWSLDTKKEEMILPVDNKMALWTVVFSPDSNSLAAGSETGEIIIWNLVNQEPEKVLKGHVGSVQSIAYCPCGGILASASTDGRVIIWDTNTGSMQIELEDTGRSVWALAFTTDGRNLLTASPDFTMRLWDLESRTNVWRFSKHPDSVRAATFTSDNRSLITVSGANIYKWDIATNSPDWVMKIHTDTIRTMAVSRRSNLLATGAMDGRVQVLDISKGTVIATYNRNSPILTTVFNNTGTALYFSGWDTSIDIWDFIGNHKLGSLIGHSDRVRALELSPDGRFLYSAGDDGTVRRWDIAERRTTNFVDIQTQITSIRHHPSLGYLVAGTGDGRILWMDDNDLSVYMEIKAHLGHVGSLDFSSSTEDLVSSGSDEKVGLGHRSGQEGEYQAK
jgi:WD40 repeat protein